MKNQNIIITLIAIIAIFIGAWKITDWYYSKKLNEAAETLRRQKIKNSELTKINDGLYTKLAADTLTIKDLKKLNDSLGLELENPETVTVVKWKIKYLDKPVDSVGVKDSTLTLVDSYPDALKPFVTYRLNLDLNNLKGNGSWDFTPQEIYLGIGQNEDGTYSVNSKVPDFFEITGLDVQSLPMETQKPDNFGILLGANVGRNFMDKSNLYGLSGGLRLKKFYVDTDVLLGDNTLIGLFGVKIEF